MFMEIELNKAPCMCVCVYRPQKGAEVLLVGAARKRAELGPVKPAMWFMWQNSQQRDRVVFGMVWQWHEGDGGTCEDTQPIHILAQGCLAPQGSVPGAGMGLDRHCQHHISSLLYLLP